MPRKPRSAVINLKVTRIYHVCSHVRPGGWLAVEGDEHRKEQIRLLVVLFHYLSGIDVITYSLQDDHFHLIIRVWPEDIEALSALETAEHWAGIHWPRTPGSRMMAPEPAREQIRQWAQDPAWVEATRQKLSDVGQFMKDLKQPVSEAANREEGTKGHFWWGRYACTPITSEEQLLTTLVYVDLNPFAAGKCELPEEGRYTGLYERLQSRERVFAETRGQADAQEAAPAHTEAMGGAGESGAAGSSVAVACPEAGDGEAGEAGRAGGEVKGRRPSVDCLGAAEAVEQALRPEHYVHLVPLEKGTVPEPPPELGPLGPPVPRPVRPLFGGRGMRLEDYLKVIDYVARLMREGKAYLDAAAQPILERLGSSAERLQDHLDELRARMARRGYPAGVT